MLSWQTIYYYKTGLICLNSILEMPSTLSVKSLLVVGFHTHTHRHIICNSCQYIGHCIRKSIMNFELKFFSVRNVPVVLKRKTKFFLFFFPTKLFFSKNVPWVLKRMQKKYFSGGGGGFWGVWGAPRPHPVVARGRKTIHFFLWPWHVTG